MDRYRKWYAALLCLYPKPFRERFREEMEQTFNDALRERAGSHEGLFALTIWMFADTFMEILRGNIAMLMARHKHIIRPAVVSGLILLTALISHLFTDEMNWGVFDFIQVGAILFGAGLAYEALASRVSVTPYRVAAGLAVTGTVLLIWITLAVGIIGSDDNPANAMFLGVLIVEVIGVFLARFRPQGLARALFATAFAQALVAAIAVIARMQSPESGMVEILALNAFFVTLFVASAILFQRADSVRLKAQPTC